MRKERKGEVLESNDNQCGGKQVLGEKQLVATALSWLGRAGGGFKEAGSAVVLNHFLMVFLPAATRSPGDAAEGNTSMTVLAVVRVESRTSKGGVKQVSKVGLTGPPRTG